MICEVCGKPNPFDICDECMAELDTVCATCSGRGCGDCMDEDMSEYR